ncbi:hypothetical protein HOY80DRAFT_963775 [Tuber brumale]|nr:hypothetical protein HOY80DRAFT_963775 [Tuber brumale]
MSTTTNLHPPSSHALPQTPLTPTTRHMVLWIHDPDGSPTLSKREAVLNYDLFPPHVARPGDIAEVKLMSSLSAGNVSDDSTAVGGGAMERKKSYTNSMMEEEGTGVGGRAGGVGGSTKVEKKFLFVIRELEPEQRAKPNLQVRP